MSLKLSALGLLLAFLLITPSAAAADREPLPEPKTKHLKVASKKRATAERLSTLRSRVSTERELTWTCQRSLARRLYRTSYSERHARSTRYLLHLVRKWDNRKDACREDAEHLVLRDFVVADGNRAWHRSVAQAQRAYPGTTGWLLSCSSSEGGHGRWVPNSQGSGVGGWLQFMPGTFRRMFTAAKADVQRRGFVVPASAASWYSPLGQALAGAWGVTHGRRHEWAGSGCR